MNTVINRAALPSGYPTHLHEPTFWEALGRAVGTFGFLEETLGKAIFSFTATKPIPEAQLETEFARWLPTLERALSDPLGGLIDAYGKAVRLHPHATITNLDVLLADLREAAKVRNAICHGSWRSPDGEGRSIPLYVTKRMEVFETPVDRKFLIQLREHTSDLICSVIDTVTHMGWQFPGSNGPGEPIFRRS